eukprot:CAMPEP_0114510092 /NCGR_PEP_ID=MMETSP0109-20121206/13588_1 /TAXON_ID=29199 /ORGANISM="Chlorarachnion reptans, Strain CCCM449" /LENGTH=497 /DNA_ID=CAMNT_0001689347 /DNA_START=9 /DNA_END=1499 /DNA_ORIENTATION=-
MALPLLLLLLLRPAVLARAASYPNNGIAEAVQDGFFPGRSADVILMPENMPEDTTVTLFGTEHDAATVPANMGVKEVRDIVGQAFGLPTRKQVSFMKDNVFKRPTLNFMVMVHGLGKDTVQNNNLENIDAITGNNPTINLKDVSYPRQELALSVTLTTGEQPSVHGLVSEEWQTAGQTHKALENGNHAETANLADLMTQYYGDESLALSISSSKAESLAHSPHRDTKSTMSCFYDSEAKSFKASNGSPELKWSLDSSLNNIANSDFAEMWNRMKLAGGAVTFLDSQSVVVKSDRMASEVTFDLQDPIDASFFSELFYAKTVAKKLATSTSFQRKLSDSTPDSVVISFRGLIALGKKYGFDSKHYLAALKLYDSALPLIINNFIQLSPKSFVGEMVLMGSPIVVDENLVKGQLAHLSLSSDSKYLPAIYLGNDHVNPSHTCQTIRMSLDVNPSGIKTFCLNELPNHPQNTVLVSLLSTSFSNSNVTAEELKKFQIVLW